MSRKQERKRARREAERRRREQLRRRARRRNLLMGGIVAAAVVVIAVAVWLQASTDSGGNGLAQANPTRLPAHLPGEMTGPPPWPANDGPDLQRRLKLLHLPLGAEMLAYHIHQHLDVYVHGKKLTVPALIGILPAQNKLTVLHTHDNSGIIHVESPVRKPYSLGQFFGVWGLRLTRDCIGGLCDSGSDRLRAYVDGKRVEDPAKILLRSHQEIVLAYGTASQLPEPIPRNYDFPPGD